MEINGKQRKIVEDYERLWKIMEDCGRFHGSLWKSLEMFGRKVYKGGLPLRKRDSF